MSAEYIALMNVAARIARQAGDLVYAGRRAGAGTVQTKSSATDMVTEWDAASEQLILQQLGLVRPGDSIIGEEGTQIVGTSPYTWFVDPIDGTTNFLYNLSGYAISIAACIGVEPVAAAVFLPATRELFVAAQGHGAWLGSNPLRVSSCESLDTALIGTGFSYSSARRDAQGQRRYGHADPASDHGVDAGEHHAAHACGVQGERGGNQGGALGSLTGCHTRAYPSGGGTPPRARGKLP